MGKLLAIVLLLLAIAAIAVLAFRPARVIGTNEKALAYSLRQEADSPQAACRGEDDRFRCILRAPGSPAASAYRLSVDDWGCWDAESRGGGEASGAGFEQALSGCITIADLIRTDD